MATSTVEAMTATASGGQQLTYLSPPLTVRHLLDFLVGRSESILAAMHDRSTFWVGLLLVFAAALAREYDGEDLRREPWHLIIPMAASVAVSFPLFLLIRRWQIPRRPLWEEYRAFLG